MGGKRWFNLLSVVCWPKMLIRSEISQEGCGIVCE
jgi:hypothetical protein